MGVRATAGALNGLTELKHKRTLSEARGREGLARLGLGDAARREAHLLVHGAALQRAAILADPPAAGTARGA